MHIVYNIGILILAYLMGSIPTSVGLVKHFLGLISGNAGAKMPELRTRCEYWDGKPD
jgi:glycerol-3-phosphate acyltransferase PlsY